VQAVLIAHTVRIAHAVRYGYNDHMSSDRREQERQKPADPKGADTPSWLRPPRPTTGRPRRVLDRDQIVAAAVRIIDAEGVEALSMRRLAAELGAGATSVYRHVRDRDELLDLALDSVTGELESPPPGIPWRQSLEVSARRLRELFHRHPHFILIRGTRTALGPHTLSAFERTLGVLREAGFSDRAALFGASTIVKYVLGFTSMELLPRLQLEADGRDPGEYMRLLNAYVLGLQAEDYVSLVALAPLLIGHDDEEFDFGLAVLLQGIEGLSSAPGRE
jgi:AcrR family transcriptional regulator